MEDLVDISGARLELGQLRKLKEACDIYFISKPKGRKGPIWEAYQELKP